VFVKNITLSVDEKVLAAVRRYAAGRDSSVNALVRGFLQGISERENHAQAARERLRELGLRSKARIGVKTWNRESLHES
jgi:hypothetical protein